MLVHPLLVPGAWLVRGRYLPAGRPAQRVLGVSEIHASDQFPETLEVVGEVRDADDPGSRPVSTSYHLDVISTNALRFRMDSLPLGTVLVGEGFFSEHSLVIQYGSPDRRIIGCESFVAVGSDEMHTTGVLLADGVAVTRWLAHLERMRS